MRITPAFTASPSTTEFYARLVASGVGFDLGVMQILANHRISYIVKATNANSISTSSGRRRRRGR